MRSIDKTNSRTFGRRAFTLAELLIVVAIIAVLVGISIPIFTAQREKSAEAADIANMRAAKAAAVQVFYAGITDEDSAKAYGFKWWKGNSNDPANASAIYIADKGTFSNIATASLKEKDAYGAVLLAFDPQKTWKKAGTKEIENYVKFEKTKVEIANQVEELGLGAATYLGNSPTAWAANIKSIVENCNLQFKNEEANRQRNEIEMALVKVRERLGYFESLEKEYKIYQKRLERQNESLVPVEYVKKHLSELMTYQETGQLLRELTEAWERIKQNYEPDLKLPEDFENTKKGLIREEQKLVADWRKLNPYRIDQKDIVWIRKAIILAERMEKELTKEPKLTVTDEMLVQYGETISQIEEKLVRLRAKNENALGNLNDEIEKYFKCQKGISEAYRNYKPVYSMDEKMLMLVTDDGEYPKANVGSKSNYMFLHLCYFFGLHDLLMKNRNEQIPQFLFIDQPSIPYYADKNTAIVSKNGEITNDDREKLKEAFRLTDMFMREMIRNGHFQIIMIEHAEEDYWNNLETFVTRYKFRNGEGLIPSRITHRRND